MEEVQNGELRDSYKLRLLQGHLDICHDVKQPKEEEGEQQQLMQIVVVHLLHCHRKYQLLHLPGRKWQLSEVRAWCYPFGRSRTFHYSLLGRSQRVVELC